MICDYWVHKLFLNAKYQENPSILEGTTRFQGSVKAEADGMSTGNEKWKGMTWGMMPLFAGALTACTYHFFYNSKELEFLVTIQAALTWIGNATLWAAAYRIHKDTEDSLPESRYASFSQRSIS